MRPTIEAAGGDDLIARTQQGHQDSHLCRHPRGGGDCSRTTFQGGDALFKAGGRGVHDTCVDIAEALQGKEMGGMIGIVKDKRGGLINGHSPRTRSRVGSLSRVD